MSVASVRGLPRMVAMPPKARAFSKEATQRKLAIWQGVLSKRLFEGGLSKTQERTLRVVLERVTSRLEDVSIDLEIDKLEEENNRICEMVKACY